ncbi:MAG: DoxX family protein, partial [Actinobacteria bacterium]|nr:DoxX family protein [Actinomycetota bacterium]
AGGALMFVFILGISQAAIRGLSIDCGCFGGGGQVAAGKTKYLVEIFRDIGLLGIALVLAKFPRGKFGLDR